MDNLDKVLINFQVLRYVRRDFKIACVTLGTTMTAVLVDAVLDAIDEAIVRAAAEREKEARDG